MQHIGFQTTLDHSPLIVWPEDARSLHDAVKSTWHYSALGGLISGTADSSGDAFDAGMSALRAELDRRYADFELVEYR